MLLRIACVRCRLASLWTDEPRPFLATVCRAPKRCHATLVDEGFVGLPFPAVATALSHDSPRDQPEA